MRIMTKHIELELAHFLFVRVGRLELYLGPDVGMGKLVVEWNQ